jgi:hypothetical protein
MAVTGRAKSRYPNQEALVNQLADYEDEPIEELPPVPPPPAQANLAPPPPPAYQARVNPDGSVEAPEPGEPGYVPPGAVPPPYVPPNGNTGITGGIDPTNQVGTVQPAGGTHAPIQGFDFGKLSGTTPYESAEKYSDAVRVFSRGLGAGVPLGRNNLGPMVSFAQANGFPNARAVGDDKIDFGDGAGPIDVWTSADQPWFQNGPDRLEAPAAAPPAAPGGVQVPIDGGGVGTPVPQPGVPVPIDDGGVQIPVGGTATGPNAEVSTAFRDALIKILNEPEPSLTDPALAARSQANSVAQQRSAERRRAAAAERMAVGGQNGGALDSEVDNILSAQGDAVGAFDAGLLSDAQGERHQRLMGALSPALAAMGIDQQQAQFIQSQLQNNKQFLASLSQQDRQFLQNLGFQIGRENANLNQNALIALLGR